MILLPHLEALFTWLLAASWQASVLALLVFGIQKGFGARLNPRWRHALWLLVLLRLILPALPESALSLFQFAPATPAAITASVSEPLFAPEPLSPSPVLFTERPSPTTPFTVYSLLAVLWLTGAVALLILTWIVNHRFARQVKNSPAITDPEILRLFAEARSELGLRRTIRLIENGQVTSPAIMGLFQPTLLLPTDVGARFDPTELRLIFLHELAHLKRGDVIVQALIALLQILHWFNPVLWYAFRRMRIDREPATDALVLSRVGEAEKERYGLMLIKLLEHFNQRHSLPTLVGILEDKDQFKRRFSLIAKFTRGAYGWSLLGVIIIVALAVAGLTQTNRFVKDPNLPYVLDLKPFYDKTFLDPAGTFASYSGRHIIDGLPFDIGHEIILYGQSTAQRNQDYPRDVAGIKIGRKFDELHLVHAAQWREYYGCPVATVRLHYADGTSADFTIRDEFQVNDWNRLLTENDEFVADPDTKIIWRGAGAAKGTGRLFKSVLHNPSPGKRVDSMELISTGSYMSYVLVAATVAQTDPARAVTPPLALFPSRNFDTTLNVHVTDQATGKPITGAEVYTAWVVQDVNLVGDPVLTGPDGIAAIKYPKAEATDLQLEVGKAGYLTDDTHWQNGLDVPSAPPDIFYQLTPGRDPSLDARTVIGHWKLAAGSPANADITTGAYFYLTPKFDPPPIPDSANTQKKRQEWFRSWLPTDAGKKFTQAQRAGTILLLKSDGTFGAESVPPGDYTLSGMFSNHGIAGHQFQFRSIVIPKNTGTNPTTPVDLGVIEIPSSDPAGIANPPENQIPDEGRLYHALVYEQTHAGPAQLMAHPYQFIADIRNTVPNSLGTVGLPPVARWPTNPVPVVATDQLVGAHFLYTQGFDSLADLMSNFPNGDYAFNIGRASPGNPPRYYTSTVAFSGTVAIPSAVPSITDGTWEAGKLVLQPNAAVIHFANVPGATLSWEIVDGGNSAGGAGTSTGTLDLSGMLQPGHTYQAQLRFINSDRTGSINDSGTTYTYSTLLASIVQFTITVPSEASATNAAQNIVTAIPSVPGSIPQGMVRVATKIVEISEADYQAHHSEIDAAAQRGDVEPLSRLKSFNLVAEPAVLTKSGEQGVMEAVRVVPYPVAFKKDENGKTVPTDFARKNVGVRFVLKPTYANGKIDITGALTVSSLQGWKKVDANASQPIFLDDGIPSVSVTLESGQTIALKTQYPAPLADNPTAFFGPEDTTHQPSKELRRIFLFLTAVAYPQATNDSPGPAATPEPDNKTTQNLITSPPQAPDQVRPPATQPVNQTDPSFFNKSGYFGSPINAPLNIVMTLVEVDEKAYELNPAAMDNAVKNGDSHFFDHRKDAYVAPDASIDFPTDKGWYSSGYVQSYIGSAKYEKLQGTVHTTLQAVAIFNGINADFAVSSLPGNTSINSTWSDAEPEAAQEQNFDPNFSPASFPTTLNFTPKMHTAQFTDKGWKIEPGVTHGFWVGETFGQFTRTTHFGDLSHTTLEEMIKTRKPSRLAVFMTAQPATADTGNGENLTVRTYLVPDHFLPDSILTAAENPAGVPVQDILAGKGVLFTDGATATFLPDSNKLVVRNTPEQLDLLANLIDQASHETTHTFLEVMSFAMPSHFGSIGFIDIAKPDEPAMLQKLQRSLPDATLDSFSLKLNKNTYQGRTASGFDYEIVVDWNGQVTNPTQPVHVFLKWTDASVANSPGYSSGYSTTFSLDKDLFVIADAKGKPIPALLIRFANRPFKISGNLEMSGHTATALPAPNPATPLDPTTAQLTYKLPQRQTLYENLGTQVVYDHTTYTNGHLVPNPALDQPLLDLVRDGRTDKVGQGDAEKIAELLHHGADPNAKDKDGTSALTWALNFGQDDAAQLLIQHGADGTPVDSNGENAAWLAAKIYFCPGALDLLIKKGVSIAGLNKNGQPILISMLSVRPPLPGKMNYLNDRAWTDADMTAYDEREHRTVDLLIAAGADFNGKDGTQTPLMRAVQSGHAEAVRALLAHGANATYKDAGGQTALSTAQAFHPELAPLIEEALAHPATHTDTSSPQQQYLAIYLATRPPAPDDLAHEQDILAKLEALKAAYPTWEAQLVDSRIAKTKASIAALQANDPGLHTGLTYSADGTINLPSIATRAFANQVTTALSAPNGDAFRALVVTRDIPPYDQTVLDGSLDSLMIWLRHQPTWHIDVIPLADMPDSAKTNLNDEPVFGLEIRGFKDDGSHRIVFPVCKAEGTYRIAESKSPAPTNANTQMLNAVQTGDTAALQKLFDNGLNPDAQKSNPVYWAVYYHQPAILKMLLDHDAEADRFDPPGDVSPIELARQSHPDLVPILQAGMARNRPGHIAQLTARLDSIHLDLPAFRDAPLGEVIQALNTTSAQSDPDKKGVAFVLRISPATTAARVTLPAMKNVSITEALQALTKAANLEYKVDESGVYLRDLSVVSNNEPQSSIQVGLKILEIDDDLYQANQDKIDAAVGNADIGFFNNLKGASLFSTPTVTTMPGLKANIDIVRKFPYPISFDSAQVFSRRVNGTNQNVAVPPTPNEFVTKDVGVSAELTPTIAAGNSPYRGKIILTGKLTIVDFEGFSKSNVASQGVPAFNIRESPFIEAVDDNQLKAIWIPGIRLDEETVTQRDSTTGKILSEKKRTVPKRLLLFLCATVVK